VHAPLATPRYAVLTGEFQQPAKQRAPGAQRKPPADQPTSIEARCREVAHSRGEMIVR